ncbi:MAG: nucleotidyltransferase domain-containing protein [Oscillospiraceae bacterium]|nr:nucleotidyltransferase domain-containing protein [Oscillospiraceae bacterium]MBO5918455.1 nucleotidyltransferase domain-containing protein [Oscillospiraceae bacterium]
MIELSSWLPAFLQALDNTFAQRIWFVGLQGSYGRSEATQTSDIDMVVILDELSPTDIQAYHDMLDTLPHRESICGFLAGKTELLHWEASDLFQFYYDTTPIVGNLDELLALIDDAAVDRAIKTGVCNLYHGCVHNMLHEKSEEILKELYKAASFVVQALYFQQTGYYIRRQTDLLPLAAPRERALLETFLSLKSGGTVDFHAMSEALFLWCRHRIEQWQ